MVAHSRAGSEYTSEGVGSLPTEEEPEVQGEEVASDV